MVKKMRRGAPIAPKVCVDKIQTPATRKVCADKIRRRAKCTKAVHQSCAPMLCTNAVHQSWNIIHSEPGSPGSNCVSPPPTPPGMLPHLPTLTHICVTWLTSIDPDCHLFESEKMMLTFQNSENRTLLKFRAGPSRNSGVR